MNTASSSLRPTLPPRQRAQIMMAMVGRIARRVAKRVPSHIQMDDLVGAGALGLAEAYTRRGAMNGSEFEGFASCRIQGAMLDQLRSWDPLSRRQRRMARVVDAVEAKNCGEATGTEDVAARLGVDESELNALLALRAQRQSDSELLPNLADTFAASPEELVSKAELISKVVRIAEKLPAREKLVVTECYVNGLSQKEVAIILGVTESRVSQIHTKAMSALSKLDESPRGRSPVSRAPAASHAA